MRMIRGSGGFTLVEVIIASILLAIITAGVAVFFMHMVQGAQEMDQLTKGLQFSREKLEEMRTIDVTVLPDGPGIVEHAVKLPALGLSGKQVKTDIGDMAFQVLGGAIPQQPDHGGVHVDETIIGAGTIDPFLGIFKYAAIFFFAFDHRGIGGLSIHDFFL